MKSRAIVNIEQTREALSQMEYVYVYGNGNEDNKKASVEVEYFEGKTFEQQVDFFRRTDIVISGHGAQLTGIPFMDSHSQNSCKHVMELYPEDYAPTFFFGSLAIQSGLRHSYVYWDKGSAPDPMSNEKKFSPAPPLELVMPWERVMGDTKEIRWAARSHKFCPRPDAMMTYVAELVMDWYQCHGCI